jgi:hypothetical protein
MSAAMQLRFPLRTLSRMECETFLADPDLFILSKELYEERWLPYTKVPYEKFGQPLSCQAIWQKSPSVQACLAVVEDPLPGPALDDHLIVDVGMHTGQDTEFYLN